MRRKIISHGPSSLTISLPSNWVKEHELKKGDEIDIFEEDEGLVVKPINTSNGTKKTNIVIESSSQNTWKDYILILHSQGYDEINIRFEDENTIKQIYSFLNEEQLGFEIIEQNNNNITIRNISNPQCDQFANLFRRIFRMTNEYGRKIEAIMIDKNKSTESRLLYQATISRISNYCRRIVIKENKKTSTFYCNIIDNINNINQEFTNILEQIREEQKTDDEVKEAFQAMIEAITQTYNLYYKFSMQEYSEIKERLETIQQIIEQNNKLKNELNIINKNTKRLLPSILALQF